MTNFLALPEPMGGHMVELRQQFAYSVGVIVIPDIINKVINLYFSGPTDN